MRGFLLSLVVLMLAGQANADFIFNFEFADDPSDDNLGNTHVAGVVEGRIFGLTDNSFGQQATAIIIDSHPTWDVGFGDFDADGIDLVANGNVFFNTFDVVDGVITDAFFISNFSPFNGGTAQLRLNSQDTQEPGANVLRHQNITGPAQSATGNRDGFKGITFSVVPEPSSAVIGLIGLIGLIGCRRR